MAAEWAYVVKGIVRTTVKFGASKKGGLWEPVLALQQEPPSSFSIIAVSGRCYQAVLKQCGLFSLSLVPKQRIFLGRAIYVLGPPHLRDVSRSASSQSRN